MTSGIYILSIGPKQGKTVLAGALAAALRQRGLRPAVMKPIDLGCALSPSAQPVTIGGLPGASSSEELAALSRLAQLAGPPPAATLATLSDGAFVPRDAPALLAAAQLQGDLSAITPYRFAAELDPAVLTRLAQGDLALEQIAQALQQLARQADQIIVEGLSGPLAPLTSEALQADLIRMLRLPALLLAPSAAGVTSHCLLALEALRSRGIPLAGVVLNRLQEERQPEEASSPYQIERFAGPLVRGVLPFFTAAQLQDWEYLGQRLEVYLDLDSILSPEH